jgi:antitoxin component YwqK of YwqJK toxin-antitoxin module
VRDAEGNVSWTRDYAEDGTEIWITYWPDGQTRTRSTWRDGRAEGEAVLHDPSGRPVYRVEFQHGLPIRESGDPGEH